MNELQIFENPDFGEIRTIEQNGEAWFIASDVCRALDIGNPTMAIDRLDDDEHTLISIEGIGKGSPVNVVNEPGLYGLVLGSRKQEAKNFKRWIKHEVLPSIRKHGLYAIDELLETPDLAIQALTALKEERERRKALESDNAKQKQLIGELKPLADYTDIILKNKALVTINQISKDYGMSARQMNKLLHEFGVQYKQSDQWLLYEKYHACGYTHSETVQIKHSNGRPDVKMHTKWTQKGRLFLYHLLKGHGVLPVIERDQQQTA